jgi:hypothetical protein
MTSAALVFLSLMAIVRSALLASQYSALMALYDSIRTYFNAVFLALLMNTRHQQIVPIPIAFALLRTNHAQSQRLPKSLVLTKSLHCERSVSFVPADQDRFFFLLGCSEVEADTTARLDASIPAALTSLTGLTMLRLEFVRRGSALQIPSFLSALTALTGLFVPPCPHLHWL